MNIYIVRHGETEANLLGVFQGRMNSQLLESGFHLARQVGAALADVRFDVAFSSPLSRAWDTGRTLLDASGNADVPLQCDDRLLEISMGDFEGKRFRPGEREVDAESVRLFFEDPFAFAGFPDGENVHDVCARTQSFLAELASRGSGNALVSTHGFALRAMLNKLYANPADFWQGHVPYNCTVSIVEAHAQQLRLVAFDQVLYDESLVVDRYARH